MKQRLLVYGETAIDLAVTSGGCWLASSAFGLEFSRADYALALAAAAVLACNKLNRGMRL